MGETLPQLNPVEHLWEEIREKWFPNLVFGLTGLWLTSRVR